MNQLDIYLLLSKMNSNLLKIKDNYKFLIKVKYKWYVTRFIDKIIKFI